tara:strand:- start:5196 stop:5525 length:330 start_codon:yes stop_codon:yes gene_type:complete
MRNWVDGAHFPDAAKIEIRTKISNEARENLTGNQVEFLSALGERLSDCDWTEHEIGSCIKSIVSETGVGGRDAYVALYWAILGKSHGPKASSLMAEMERDYCIQLVNQV